MARENLRMTMSDPLTLSSIRAKLSAPFAIEQVEVKPGATSDSGRALALAYVDARHYQQRLDDVVGPENWSVEYRPVSDRAMLCRLTIMGAVREDVGEEAAGDPNQTTSAAMQSFKRACAAFGLGRYLYTDLPQLWVEAEKKGRGWVIKDQRGAVKQIYDNAGIELDKRSAYISRIKILLSGLDETALLALGKQLSGKANA